MEILDGLRAAPGEVAHIFDHPLEALLDPELARGEKLVSVGSEDWPYEAELYVEFFVVSRACGPHSILVFFGLTELHGQCLDGHDDSHASFSEHRFSDQGIDGGHSGATSPLSAALD